MTNVVITMKFQYALAEPVWMVYGTEDLKECVEIDLDVDFLATLANVDAWTVASVEQGELG